MSKSRPALLLNCDLGESFGSWTMGLDEQAMPHIDLANIACGFHGGDPDVMVRTLKLAKQHGVTIGAHPSYPDLQGFGRRSMHCSASEIVNLIHYQVAALDGMAQCQGLNLSYIKPHGALYNDMMAKPEVWQAVLQAVASYHKPLKLMILATADAAQYQQQAAAAGVNLLLEAFADRRYTEAGKLTPRSQAGAVLHGAEVLTQVRQLVTQGSVTTDSGKTLPLAADTLCVHGDNVAAITQLTEIRELLRLCQ
ncbi:5-oxoprolinase subunit PxpA [Alishewanella sp. BS5-314]|uniref:5-oxoprolinase subunit PxpA n=1 Tax=Alishewanella sp. BS5-314 TaxID=2755587 RepID=UPI0021BA6795|nr:5-oxoprolinase subunit PxpA [Alishewanella sp. BS5-314]MCT8127259.1 5-oxoprolinase subunit PxpA [Alishewanella sp. BS5-314]